MITKILISLIGFLTFGNAFGQDLTAIKSASPLKVSGSLYGGFNYTANDNSNIPPVGYNAGLNINFNLYDVLNIPFNFSYSSYGTSFNTLSLKRFGISPSYKTLKLHAGYRSYVLSPYLMAGLTVIGGGIELSPKKFNLLAFYGKISDPYSIGNEFLEFRNQDLDLYDRNTYGIKFGFGKTENRISIVAFHAKDNTNSGTIDSLKRYNVRGKENFALGIDMSQSLFQVLTLSGNGAVSILTHDVEGKEVEYSNALVWINRTSFLTTVNGTTRHAFAYDAKISLRIKTFNVGFKYQHIDPFYNTLGVSYLQNNFDNYLVDMNGNLLNGKFNFFSSFGVQYVNANGYTGLPQKKIVANVNTNFNFTKSLNLNANYSNMVQNSNPKVEDVNDSLSITTNNRGWSGTVNYKPGKEKERPHLFSLNGSSNTFDVINMDTISLTNTNNNANINYKYTLKNKWSFGGGLQFNTGQSSSLPSVKRYGVLLNAGKTITEGLNLKVNGSYRLNETAAVKDGYVINVGSGLNYQYKKSHRLSLNVTQLIRKTNILVAKNETRFRINYNYSF